MRHGILYLHVSNTLKLDSWSVTILPSGIYPYLGSWETCSVVGQESCNMMASRIPHSSHLKCLKSLAIRNIKISSDILMQLRHTIILAHATAIIVCLRCVIPQGIMKIHNGDNCPSFPSHMPTRFHIKTTLASS